MNRLFFAIFAFAVIVAIVVFGTITVKNSSGELLDLFDKIEACANQNDIKTAATLCKKAEDKWIQHEKKLTLFVNHADICEIGTEIAAMKPLIEHNEKAEFFSTLNSTRTQLIHLASMENINTK